MSGNTVFVMIYEQACDFLSFYSVIKILIE